MCGVGREFRLDHVDRRPSEIRDLLWIGRRRSIERARQNVQVLALRQPGHRIVSVVPEFCCRFETRRDSELLVEAALGRADQGLAGARMAAAGVRPSTGEVVLARGALLEEQPAPSVKQEDRERPVQLAAVLMRGKLLRLPHCAIRFVDKDDPLSRHDRILDPWRLGAAAARWSAPEKQRTAPLGRRGGQRSEQKEILLAWEEEGKEKVCQRTRAAVLRITRDGRRKFPSTP